MQYLGDFAEDASVFLMFSSHDLAGNPIAPSSDFEAADFQVYKDATETPLATNGVTINAQPYNSVTGLHHITIDTSAHADYSTGSDYIVVLNPDETVDGQNVLRVLGYFSIENRHATKARGEPGLGAPPVSTTPQDKIDYLYKAWRNKKDNDGSQTQFYADDASTVDHTQSTTVSGGTVTKGEIASP